MRLGDLLRELIRSGPGKVGLALLVLMAAASLYVLATYPSDYGTARWGNPALWADNPRTAPPSWIGLFDGVKHARHRILAASQPTDRTERGRAYLSTYDMPFSHTADEPPGSLTLSLSDVVYHSRPPIVTAYLVRPDGHEVMLYRAVVSAPRPGESAPFRRHTDVPLRISLTGEERAVDETVNMLHDAYGLSVPAERMQSHLLTFLFGRPARDGATENGKSSEDGSGSMIEPLSGEYRVKVEIMAIDPKDAVGRVEAVVGGTVFGMMGTDALGRDLAEGLLFGLPVALLIGLATSTVSTAMGTILGLVSGYLGGRVDTVIQRTADIVANIPVLPLLIFLVFIGGSQLWLILLVLVAFSWPGLTITVRSMVLQRRSGPEVEAAQALGASTARVIFRHVFPHTAAYIFAQLVFFAPSAILAEAGLSFLGLGDPSIPTWGQILEHGFRTGAVFLGYWWWVIPPGILIVLTAVTFMLLALGLEPAVDPRLRRSRSWPS